MTLQPIFAGNEPTVNVKNTETTSRGLSKAGHSEYDKPTPGTTVGIRSMPLESRYSAQALTEIPLNGAFYHFLGRRVQVGGAKGDQLLYFTEQP
jgi:hypothetical protein